MLIKGSSINLMYFFTYFRSNGKDRTRFISDHQRALKEPRQVLFPDNRRPGRYCSQITDDPCTPTTTITYTFTLYKTYLTNYKYLIPKVMHHRSLASSRPVVANRIELPPAADVNI
ncbi:hypothetical protein AQUCO_04500103v1 [Aquilegia coerulea]|uniref:Uncharacterized protein n=1 Tax=Aquilegia coerulea TaxID=218851 RepID=A0A2G5CLV6_AQUCA|nr:hypothetical protein AQUCO_04500103v1 [Aquilegia coerulea]